MAFIASNGLTEAGTSKTISAGGMTVHYHDIGSGDPVLFLHSYGPGTTAWITFHKTVAALSQHFRCILMDLPNFSKTGPIVYNEGLHAVQARVGVALLDALGIEKAHWVGNSQGGQSSMVAAINHPERVRKFQGHGRFAHRHRRRSLFGWPTVRRKAAAPRGWRSMIQAGKISGGICAYTSTMRA